MSLFTQDDDREHKTVVAILIGAVVLFAISLATGVGLWRTGAIGGAKAATTPATVSTPVAGIAMPEIQTPAPSLADTADEPSVQVVDGVVRFYFARGKSDLAAGAKDALAEAIAAARAGKKLVISGYHDSTGSAQINAEIAKKRAFAVRDALLAEGVSADSLQLKKPEVMPNTQGSDPNARRVDVRIQN